MFITADLFCVWFEEEIMPYLRRRYQMYLPSSFQDPRIIAELIERERLFEVNHIRGVLPAPSPDTIVRMMVPADWWEQQTRPRMSQAGAVMVRREPFDPVMAYWNGFEVLRSSPLGCLHFTLNIAIFHVEPDEALERAEIVADAADALTVFSGLTPGGARVWRANARAEELVNGQPLFRTPGNPPPRAMPPLSPMRLRSRLEPEFIRQQLAEYARTRQMTRNAMPSPQQQSAAGRRGYRRY